MKKEVIATLLAFLIISTSFTTYAADISDINSLNQVEDIIKNAEQTEPEDILINVENYNPRVVPSYAFESEQYGGYQVRALLTGLQTNPLIDITKIRAVQISQFKSDVPGVVLYSKRPPFGKYTLDNLGYVIIRLPKIKDERKIPKQIDINVTAKILYNVGAGFGVNEHDLTLPQLTDTEFLQDKEKYSFWSGRGYVKLDEIKNGVARLSIYNGRLEKVNTVTLREGDPPSREMSLSYGNFFPNIGEDFVKNNFRDRFKIKLNNLDIPKDKITLELQINNKFVIRDLVEGDRLYEGSNWRVKKIFSQGNQDIIELNNEKEGKSEKLIGTKLFTFRCGDFDGNEAACLLSAECVYKDNKCQNRIQTETKQESITLGPEEQKKETDASNKFTEITKKHLEVNKQGKKDLTSLKPIIDGYAEIINNYRGTSVSNAAAQFYTKIYNNNILILNTEIIEYMDKNFPTTLGTKVSEIHPEVVETLTVSGLDSKDYYNKAIENYQKVVNNYLNVRDDKNKKYYALDAQRKIAEIYDKKLFRLDKALEAYEFLINNFEIDPVTKASYENRIKVLKSRNSYNSNAITIYEDGNSVSAALVGVDKTLFQTEVVISVNNKDQTLKIGEKIADTTWILDSVLSSEQVKLLKVDQTNRFTQETKIISISDKTETPLVISSEGKTALVRLKIVNTKNEARITILPGLEFLTSTSKFKLHIPVEKRPIQFSDKQIDNQIEGTKKTIEFLNKAIDKVETVYKYFSYYCWTIFGYISLKSIFFTGSRTLARDIVIKEYENTCKSDENVIKCDSQSRQYCITNCVLSKSKEIEEDINKAEKIVDQFKGDKYKSLIEKELGRDGCSGMSDDDCRLLIRTRLFSRQTWNEQSLGNKFVKDLVENENNIKLNGDINKQVEELRKKLYDKENNIITNNQNSEIVEIAEESGVDSKKLNQESIKKILDHKRKKEIQSRYSKYNDVNYYNKDLKLNLLGTDPSYEILEKIIKDKKVLIEKGTQPQITGLERFKILPDAEDTWYYTEDGINKNYLYEKIGDKVTIYSANTNKFNEEYKTKQFYLLDSKEVKVIDDAQTPKQQAEHKQKINLEETGNCANNFIKRVSVNAFDYIEVAKRGDIGDCAPVEFTVYRRDNANDPLGGGKVVTTQITKSECQEGKQQIKEDIKEYCKVINEISLLDNKLSNTQDKSAGRELLGTKYLIENGILQTSGLQCYHTMDPSDCKLLFSACDPVMCPPSRFNAGGKWHVNNVVASGLFGSIFLGQDLWSLSPPPEIGICIPGVLASLKNYRSLAQGYEQCLNVKKQKGENIGICDTIRSIGVCRIAWREGVAFLRLDGGALGWLSRQVFDSGSGGGEYAFFSQNLKKTGDFLDFFTNQYATTYFNAYRGGSTEEIGDKICEAAIYGKLAGPGSFLDQLTRPEGPPQFIATLEEFPHSEISGEQSSDYSVYYHIYAGESFERIGYIVWLESSTLNLGRLFVTQEGSLQQLAYLKRGEFADLTVRRTAQTGYDQICVEINRVKKCGFGKVSTDFAVDYAQEQIARSQIEKRNITSERECIPDKTILSQTTSSGLLGLAGSTVLPSGTTYSGVRRECGIEPPGKGTKEQTYWESVGICGKDDQGRDKGTCWLDKRSVNLLKNKETRDQLNLEFEEDIKIENKINELDITKAELLEELSNYQEFLKGKTFEQVKKDKDGLIEEIKNLVNKYENTDAETLNPVYSARIHFSIGELYENLAAILKSIETKENETKKVKIEVKEENKITGAFSCVVEYEEDNGFFSMDAERLNFYYRFEGGIWQTRAHPDEIIKPNGILNKDKESFKDWVIIDQSTCKQDIFSKVDGIYTEICDNLKNKNLNDGIGYLGYLAAREDDDQLVIHTSPPNPTRRTEISHSELEGKENDFNYLYNLITSKCSGTVIQTQQTIKKEGPEIENINKIIEEAAQRFNVRSSIIKAQVQRESEYKPNAVGYSVKKCGEAGLMQLLPGTALENGKFTDPKFRIEKIYKNANNVGCDQTYGNDLFNFAQGKSLDELKQIDDRFDPVKNIYTGTNYLSRLLNKYNQNYNFALAAYNAGESRVDNAIKNSECVNDFSKCNLPITTKEYVDLVLKAEQDILKTGATISKEKPASVSSNVLLP
ncbi:MAG: transglycosylase SLT domain-containing protein, partial [Nanoarchaeota archaeon]